MLPPVAAYMQSAPLSWTSEPTTQVKRGPRVSSRYLGEGEGEGRRQNEGWLRDGGSGGAGCQSSLAWPRSRAGSHGQSCRL